jgi:hypothetical protein
MSQMLADLILQFFALNFCFPKRGDKKPKKKKKKKKRGGMVLIVSASPSTWASRVAMCH